MRVFGSGANAKWSRDGRFLYLSMSANSYSGMTGVTFALPVRSGRSLPELPPEGFTSMEAIAKAPGVHVIKSPDVAPGLKTDVYAFSRETVHRNLYLVPVP